MTILRPPGGRKEVINPCPPKMKSIVSTLNSMSV
jgi:hypothetical protein